MPNQSDIFSNARRRADEGAAELPVSRMPGTAAPDCDASCRKAVDAFIAQRMTAEEFHRAFRHSTGGNVADPRLLGWQGTVRKLCDAYANGLPPGAGYRVSAEQFRSEVCHFAQRGGILVNVHPRTPDGRGLA